MPNWCSNSLIVTGSEKDVKKFRDKARGPTQSYNSFSPHEVEKWPVHDYIRLKSLITTPPEPGEVVALSFHALYPVPEDFRCFPYDDARAVELGELVGETRPYGGYRWEGMHWGCKWGSCDSELQAEGPDTVPGDGYLNYQFSTAWGPPIEFFDRISQDWPNLTFSLEYEEPGMGFRGEATWEEGSLVHEHTAEYHHEDEE